MSPVVFEDPLTGRIMLLTQTERRDIVDRLNQVVHELSAPGVAVGNFETLIEERRQLEYQLAADSFNPVARKRTEQGRLKAAA